MLSELWNKLSNEVGVAAGAAIISFAAAGIALWQARIAKDQALSARSAAVSAREQADAAKAQLELMQRQVEGEEQARLEASGPQLELTSAHTDRDDWSESYAAITFRQVSGPAITSVRLHATGDGVDGLRRKRDYGTYGDGAFDYETVQQLDIGPMAAGGSHTLQVSLDYDTSETKIQLHLSCSAGQNQPSWERSLQANAAPSPEPAPVTRRRRGQG
ncbi:hypothetical protein [Streptomyces sp. NPDC013740]|uniref:hypothetical protein n=1 Tax=Streptomyces sp. NPDC013740 TaxID=3364867 RepID=UPI0036FBB31F